MGKVLCAILGFFLGGPWGALAGFFLGLALDQARPGLLGLGGNADEAKRVFFRSTFAVMGHVCKVDGRVTQAEIAAAENMMAQLALSPVQRREAIRQFNRGKSEHFDLDAELAEFRRACRGHINLVRMFLEIQIQAVLADGNVTQAERSAIQSIARSLGLSEMDVARLEAMLSAGAHYGYGGSGPSGSRGGRAATSRSSLKEAYSVLGVSEDTSDAEVKKAYRRLMNQHHPDKLVAKGLPEEMMKMAEEKTRRISAAYDTIRKARNQAA